MTTIVARFKVLPGKEDEAEKAIGEMVAAVQANEPGALAYIMHRSRKDPGEITVFEVYADDEALDTHNQTAHMGQFRSAFGQLFDAGSVKIERLERIAGFIRPPA